MSEICENSKFVKHADEGDGGITTAEGRRTRRETDRGGAEGGRKGGRKKARKNCHLYLYGWFGREKIKRKDWFEVLSDGCNSGQSCERLFFKREEA